MRIVLILRKSSMHFKSIEAVYASLSHFMDYVKKVLPFESKGLKNRVYNIFFAKKQLYDILHISGHDHYLLWIPFKNSILTIHDIEALRRKSGIRRWIFKKLWFDIPIRNATMVTTISEFTKNELLGLGNDKTPIHVVPNPLTINVDFQPKYDLENMAMVKILHIGTKQNKNLIRLIDAIKEMNCELTIIGQLTAPQLKSLIENKINYRNKFNIDEAALIDEYQRCDILSFVSTYEGFGLPIIEAQSIGRVVLTSNASSMPEVAGEGAYFVDPFSVDSIQQGLSELIFNHDLRKQLIDSGRINASRFDPQKIATKYNQLYKQLCNE